MTDRVSLLSSTAREFLTKPAAPKKTGGFWSGLIFLFEDPEDRGNIYPPPMDLTKETDLISLGYEPFAKIGEVRILIKIYEKDREVAFSENGELWDIADWGVGSRFRSRFLAECYFMVTKDDFKIDEREKEVLNALFGCLNPTREEINEAKAMVYWTLVESTMEDRILTDEEQDTMDQIIAALELTEKDLKELHEKAIQERFADLTENAENDPITEEKIAKIEKMATIVGLDPTFIQKLAKKARSMVPLP